MQSVSLELQKVRSELARSETHEPQSRWDKDAILSVIGVPRRFTDGKSTLTDQKFE